MNAFVYPFTSHCSNKLVLDKSLKMKTPTKGVILLILNVSLIVANPSPTTIYFPDPDNDNALVPAYLDGTAPSINAADNSSITFFLVTRENPTPTEIFAYNTTSILDSDFIPDAPLKILSHGFGGNLNTLRRVVAALLDLDEDMNIILIDWSELATSPWYTIAAPATKIVGVTSANLLKFLMEEGFVTIDQIHVIGYSLGAHVAGNIGHELGGKCPRVTALDPALPLFDIVTDADRIDPSDGQYVEVIHTSSGHLHENGLAFLSTRGHADFYPNSGKHQPGCEEETFGTCSHGWAPALYTESIVNSKSMYACGCGHWDLFLAGKCDCSTPVPFGFFSPTTARGKFYFLTQEKSPYGMGMNGLVNTKGTADGSQGDSGVAVESRSLFVVLFVISIYFLPTL